MNSSCSPPKCFEHRPADCCECCKNYKQDYDGDGECVVHFPCTFYSRWTDICRLFVRLENENKNNDNP